MKRLFTLILGVALIASMHSCKTIEENNGQIVEKKLKITAVIDGKMETRVSYDVDNTANTITPAWEVGDEVFGFDSNNNTFTLSVTATGDEGATLEPEGSYSPAEGTTVYAIYAPGYSVSDLNDNTLSVNLAAQGGVLNASTPALMCATGSVNADNELELHFANQTAIIGVKKFQLNGVTAATTVTSMTVNGVITTGMFRVKDGVLELVPGTETGSITATHPNAPDGGWTTDANGICEAGVYFAAMPTTEAPEITLNAVAGGIKYANVSSITASAMEPGKYYYMSKKLGGAVADVDGIGYATIDEAWAVANAAAAPCTVTLLADCTAAAKLLLNNTGSGDVTLDLNGCKLTTITSDYGIHVNARTLVIEDNEQGGEIESESTNKYLLYTAGSANVTISSGRLTSAYRTICVQTNAHVSINGNATISSIVHGVYSLGTLNVSGNATITADSYGIFVTDGITTISDNAVVTATENGSYGCYVYSETNDPKLVVTGGTIKSLAPAANNSTKNAIRVSTNGSAEISGGIIEDVATAIYVAYDGSVSISGNASVSSTDNDFALINVNTADQSTLNISGGRFTAPGINPVSGNGKRHVTGGIFNRPVNNGATHSDSNVPYYNTHNTDEGTKDEYPYTIISSADEGVSLVATTTRGSTVYEHATIESAINHVTVDASVSNTKIAIKLLDNVISTSPLTMAGSNKPASLDLNGHTWTTSASPALALNVHDFSLDDSGSNGEILTTGETALSIASGSVTIDNGSLVAEALAIYAEANSTVVVNGGFFYGGTSDFAHSNDEITLLGGYFKNNPTGFYDVVNYRAIELNPMVNYNSRDYAYMVQIADPIAFVTIGSGDPTSYFDFAEAIAAAKNASDNATVKMNQNITWNEVLDLTNSNGHSITIDLNGKTISTSTNQLIQTYGTLIVTDYTAGHEGTIETSGSYLFYITGASSDVTISNCKIINRWTGNASSYYYPAIVYLYNSESATNNIQSNAKLSINNSIIYAERSNITAVSNRTGELVINNSEISVGAITADSGNAVAVCNYMYAHTTINSGCFYSSNTNSTARPVIYNGSSASGLASTISINGGYFFSSTQTRNIRSAFHADFLKITVSGGYYNKDLDYTSSGNTYTPTYAEGYEKKTVSPAATYNHSIKGTLSFGWTVGEVAP